MVDFATLQKNRKNLQELTEKLQKAEGNGNYEKDARFWYPTMDKAKNSKSTIRFIPDPEGEYWVKTYRYNFKHPATGQWYIEDSPSTIGDPDPVMEYNNELWNSTSDDKSPAREQARRQARKTTFISNILVIKDEGNPENNGKTFLYGYGKKVFEKISGTMSPDDDEKEAVDVFDMWHGADFRLITKQVGEHANYDSSEFRASSPISDDDDEIKAVWSKTHDLQEFIDPKKFKSYEDLKKRLTTVLGTKKKDNTESPDHQEQVDEPKSLKKNNKPSFNRDSETDEEPRLSKPKRESKKTSTDEDDNDLDFFKNLVKSSKSNKNLEDDSIPF